MRRTTLAIALLVLIAGCGKGGTKHTVTSPPTQPANSTTPQYAPSAHHTHRPPGSVYNDEIGENITTATKSRVLQLFGPPASQHGACIRYRIVRDTKGQWEFCFKGQRMSSAMIVPAH